MHLNNSSMHAASSWNRKVRSKNCNRKSKVYNFMSVTSNAEHVGTDRRILAVNRKLADLKEAVSSNVPILRKAASDTSGPRIASRAQSKKDFFGGEVKSKLADNKVKKELLQERIEPPSNAYNLPNFGHQNCDNN